MSATHFDADDAREDRARELREQRARLRGGGAVPAEAVEEALTPPAPSRAPAIVPTTKIKVTRPMSPGGLVTEPAPDAAKIGAFEVVTELPPRPKRRMKPVPPARQEMIDFCLQRIGVWVKYTPTPEQDKASPSALATHVRKATGGFVEGFEFSTRDGAIFFRFAGVKS